MTYVVVVIQSLACLKVLLSGQSVEINVMPQQYFGIKLVNSVFVHACRGVLG